MSGEINIKKIILLMICCSILSVCGCTDNKSESVSQIDQMDIVVEETIKIEEQAQKADKEDAVSAGKLDVFPPEFEGEYLFTSGVGAWSTLLQLKADGSFTGQFSDADYVDPAEGYNSIVYRCDFEGNFKIVEKINGYSYYAALSDLKSDEKEDIIINGTKFVNSGPHGLEDGEKFVLYTPKTPISVLDEDFLWWMLPLKFADEDEKTENLGFYAIYNVQAKTGFFCDERWGS